MATEWTTSAGLTVLEQRGLRPSASASGEVPNGNDPAANPPATVGPPTARPGDPNGFEIIGDGGVPRGPTRFTASPWSGWPAEWATPSLWGRLDDLADTAWACLDLNSSVFAAMPPYLIGASESLPHDWIINPSPEHYDSWNEFARQLMWDYQMGEAILIVTSRYSNGWPARFHAEAPWAVTVEFDRFHQRQYFIGDLYIPRDDVLHIRYKTNALVARGCGPLEAGRTRLIAAAVLNRYATEFANSGGIPPSILEHPDELTADQCNDLLDQWVTARMSKLGLPAVLSGGVTWKATGINPLESAMVELAQFNESRLAVLLGVPPFLVGLPGGGDSMTYTNVSSIFDYHWRAGLKPKASRLLSALSSWLVPRATTVEVNRDEYVSPGPYERAQTWEILIRSEIVTAEEVREIERFSVAGPVASFTSGVLQ